MEDLYLKKIDALPKQHVAKFYSSMSTFFFIFLHLTKALK